VGLFATLFRRRPARVPAAPKRPAGPPPAAPAPVREYVAQTAARLGWSRAGGYWFGGRDSTNETWEMRRDYSEMTADESVDSATEAVLSDISSQTIQVLPNPADDPTRGQAVKDFVHHATTQLGSGDLSSLQTGGVPGLVDAIARHAFVHKRSACQIVLNDHRETQGRWAGKQFVRCVKPKAPESYDLDLDEMLNVRGIVNRGPDAKALPLLPLAGWILYVNRAMYGRPEGRSLYRAAHRYWLAKHRAFQLWGECSDKLTGGLLIGKGASPQNSERFFQILCEARGSGVIVLEEPGWEVILENLEQGAGAVIERFIRYCDEAIFRAIRGAHLQQLEGQVKDGRGDTKVAESQSDKPTWQHLYRISETITRYFNTYLVRHNFAPGTPVPITVLGDIDPGDTMSRLRIAAVMRNELGMELSNEQLYRTSPFGPPSKEPGDVNKAPAPPAAVRPQAQEAIPGGPLGAYSEAAGTVHTFCGGPGSGRPGPCPEPTAGHSRHRPDLPRHAGTGRELPAAPPAVSLDDAVAVLEARFGKGAIKLVDPNARAAPKPAATAPAPAAAPKPRHQQLAERESAARRRLADLEGSHDQEASFDRAAARHELELIDAERRGLPAPKFGPHRYGETAHRPPGTPEGGQFTSGPGGGKPAAGPPAAAPAGPAASRAELKAARSKARAKFAAAPAPTAEAVAAAGARMDAEGADRYEANIRGNTKDRAASRARLVAEFSRDGGKSCPCVYCGIKLVPEPEDGPNTVTRDKMYTARQGGRYNSANLVPACLACNKTRSDTPFAEATSRWK
jgi:hypothetical protein